jgi:hypothetical protein
MADFGLAIQDNAHESFEVDDPHFVKDRGTIPYLAPVSPMQACITAVQLTQLKEAFRYDNDYDLWFGVDSWSDTFVIGLIMIQLLNLDDLRGDFPEPRWGNEFHFPKANAEARSFYTAELVRLVEWCLKSDPPQRPYPEELYKDIQKVVTSVATYPHGQKGGLPMKLAELGENDVLRLKEVQYVLFAR